MAASFILQAPCSKLGLPLTNSLDQKERFKTLVFLFFFQSLVNKTFLISSQDHFLKLILLVFVVLVIA